MTAAIETAAGRGAGKELSPFARRLIREAKRRGCGRSGAHFAAAAGGAWIWNTAGEIIPDAVQILDLCHVLERLPDAAKAIYGPGNLARKRVERCAVESNTFDDFWEFRSEQKKAA